MRRDAVSTNWPTVALKPERNALNGCRAQLSACFPCVVRPVAISGGNNVVRAWERSVDGGRILHNFQQ